MAAARDRTKSAVAAVRALWRAAPVVGAGVALVAGVLVLGNPFASPPPPAPHPEIRLGAAELSLPEPAAASPVALQPKPVPAAAAAPVFVVPPAPAAAIPTATPPAAPAKRMGGGKRATIIVEALPVKPIIPPFVPRRPAGATPEAHPTLPLDIEIGTTAPSPKPAPKTAAASLHGNG